MPGWFDPRQHVMQVRPDGLCPFCGTDVGEFPVCRGCRAEKFYSGHETRFRLWDFIFLMTLTGVLGYFRGAIHHYVDVFSLAIVVDFGLPFEAFVASLLFYVVVSIYYVFMVFFAFSFLINLYDLWKPVPFTGFGWKKR